MSDVSSIYDALVTRLESLLPNHVRLPNPYLIEDNSEQFLKQGFGLAIGPAINANRYMGGKASLDRTFIVPITRKFYAREFDPVSKALAEKALMEDLFLLVADFRTNNTLNDGTNHINYVGDTGIEQVFSEKDQYLVTRIEITAAIIEAV